MNEEMPPVPQSASAALGPVSSPPPPASTGSSSDNSDNSDSDSSSRASGLEDHSPLRPPDGAAVVQLPSSAEKGSLCVCQSSGTNLINYCSYSAECRTDL